MHSRQLQLMSRFIADPCAQHIPGRDGYPAYDVMVASPELPCGAAWLGSCLLEVGVPLWKPWGIDDSTHWTHLGGRRWQYQFPGSAWSRLIPGLVHGRRVNLRERPVPQFTHAWPGQLPMPERLILFVRDPRDALHSDWRRRLRLGHKESAHLHDYLTKPSPGIGLPPPEWLARFMSAWRVASRSVPTLVIRFEDAKERPRDTLNTALRFLGLRVPARTVASAARASSHSRVVEAERKLLTDGIVPFALIGPGRPHAHRSLPKDEQVPLDRQLAEAAADYAYPTPAIEAETSCTPGATNILLAKLLPGSARPDFLEHCLRSQDPG